MKLFFRIKALIKKRYFWAVLIASLLLVYVIMTVNFPSKENFFLGIVTNGSDYAENTALSINSSGSSFEMVFYDSSEDLYADVLSGKLDCGFVFDEKADSRIQKGELKNLFTYINSPYTTKGSAGIEMLSSNLMRQSAPDIIMDNYDSLFGKIEAPSKDVSAYYSERYNYYINSEDVFMVEYK